MIPYDLDPSLHATEPHEPLLDDGFSPPPTDVSPATPGEEPSTVSVPPPVDPVLWDKSDF